MITKTKAPEFKIIEEVGVRVRYAYLIVYREPHNDKPISLAVRSSRLALRLLKAIEQSPDYQLVEYREVLMNI